MPNTHATLTSLFSDIADAIRAKTGSQATIVADNFPTAIAAIPQGGSVTQDQDGYIILPTTGGGGSSDTWTWMGKNPTKVKDYGKTKVYFKDTGYSSWTPTDTNTQLSAEYSLEAYTSNSEDYDYIVYSEFVVNYVYGSGATGTAQMVKGMACYAIDIFGVASNYSNFSAGTVNSAYAATQSTPAGVQYLNTSGQDAFTAQLNYGLYPSYYTPGVSKTSITPKYPKIYARCSTSQFSTTNAAAVDVNSSYYEIITQIWRVDKDSTAGGATRSKLRDLWLNGIS